MLPLDLLMSIANCPHDLVCGHQPVMSTGTVRWRPCTFPIGSTVDWCLLAHSSILPTLQREFRVTRICITGQLIHIPARSFEMLIIFLPCGILLIWHACGWCPCTHALWTFRRRMIPFSMICCGDGRPSLGFQGCMLAAIKSLCASGTLSMKVYGTAGAPGVQRMGVRQDAYWHYLSWLIST